MKTSTIHNIRILLKTCFVGAIVYICSLVPQMVIIQMIKNNEPASSFFAVTIVSIIFVWWLLIKTKYLSKPTKEKIKTLFSRELIIYIIGGLLALFMLTFLTNLILSILGLASETQNQEILLSIGEIIPFPVFLGLVAGAGFFEELLFRKVIYNYLDLWNTYVAILVTAILFSLLHSPTDIGSFLNYLSYGLFFGCFRHMFNNIYLNIIIHSLWNIVLAIVIFLI